MPELRCRAIQIVADRKPDPDRPGVTSLYQDAATGWPPVPGDIFYAP